MNRSDRRILAGRIAMGACLLLAVSAVYPLFSVLWTVVSHGWREVSWTFLTDVPTRPGLPGGGIRNAIIGSGMVVGIGGAIGAPIGILTGIYLAEFGRGRFAELVRTCANAFTGLPSILAGLFASAVVVVGLSVDFRIAGYWFGIHLPAKGFSAYAGGFALALLAVPVITRTTEEALRAVPNSYREAALALGAPRWRTTLFVVLPAGAAGVITGLLLACARIAGETAPLLFTVLYSPFLVTSASEPIGTLPYLIYDYAKSAIPARNAQAWGAALVLLGFVFLINIAVRLVSMRRQRTD